MKGWLALVRHSIRRRRGFLLATVIFLMFFQTFMIVAARGLEKSGGFMQIEALMPDFIKQWSNMMAASFTGFVLFGYSHPLVQFFLVAVAIGIGTEPALEIESKFVDLLMARPVRRTSAMLRTMVVLVITTALAIAAMLAATWVGLRLLAPSGAEPPEARLVLTLAANLGLMVLAWGGIALLAASFSKRRATATAICGFLAFATFVLDYVGRFWEPARPASRLSPFHYFDSFSIIGGNPLPVSSMLVLAGTFLAASILATVTYSRRDL